MKLQSLKLTNFAGVRDDTLALDGRSATIRGTNATGKTTRFTAFTWLLFGKDASGQAQFDIKTIGPDGEALHNLEHTVEGVFEIGDDTLALRKTYVEVYTKKRGSTREDFTGHRVDHYLDGVPVQKKEYDERIQSIAPEGVFRLLTDPDAFHALHWQERRQILLDVCGDVTDADVIASSPELADLPGILGKRSLEDQRKITDARRKEINRELQAIPVRIDEATNAMPDLPGRSRDAIDANLATLRDARTALERQRARLEAGGEVAELQAKVREIDGKIADAARRVTAGAEDELASARREQATKVDAANTAKRACDHLAREIADGKAGVERLDKQLADLRAEWMAVDEREAPHSDVADACPACGQALPPEQISTAHQRALEEHNTRKANGLERIGQQGRDGKASRDRMAATVEGMAAQLESAQAESAAADAAADAAAAKVAKLSAAIPDPTADAQHQVLTAERAKVEAQIASLREGNTDLVATLREDVTKLDAEIAALVQALGTFDAREKGEARVQTLATQEKALAGEFEQLERHLYLMDAFTRAKAAMLTDKINSRFSITQFRLHTEQVNGGLQDACVATVNGVPYGSGLNRAGRINSGLDVIRVLQEHHAFYPPVFIDEAESVVETIPLDAQVVRLIVDPHHPTLHVELDKELIAA